MLYVFNFTESKDKYFSAYENDVPRIWAIEDNATIFMINAFNIFFLIPAK